MKHLFNSLVARLILMGLVFMVLSTVVGHWQLERFLREDLTQVVADQQSALASYAARDIDENLSLRRAAIERLADHWPRQLHSDAGFDRAALKAWLDERRLLQPFFSSGLLVISLDGQVLADSPHVPGIEQLSLGSRQALQQFQGNGARILRPRYGPLTNRPMLPFVVPLRDARGAAQALMVGIEEISPEGFLSRLLEGRIGRAGGMLLVSPRDRLFVASTDASMVMKPTPRDGVNLLHDRAMAGFRGAGTTTNAKGIEEISAIASVPSTGWFVVARLPTSEAFGSVERLQRFVLQWRLPVMLLMLALIGITVTWMLRPLFQAAASANRMTRGELPLAPLPVARDDEVGHLTTAFNRLLGKLGDQQAELAHLAHHDNLTGLPNRKLLLERLQQALMLAPRQSTQVALLFLDLDGFKRLNDTLGHEAGDAALQQIAERLQHVGRQSDTVARLGGDEFVLLAPGFAPGSQAAVMALAQKCQDAVAQPLHLAGGEHRLGVSIGVAMSDGEHSAAELLALADQRMYRVKAEGRSGAQPSIEPLLLR